MELTRKRLYFILLLLSSLNFSFAQPGCVDWDVSRYPKIIGGKTYQWNGAAWNVPNPVQTKVTGLHLDSDNYYRGLLEYRPDSYNAGNTVKHPLIIFFHGSAASGNGTESDLCRIYKDTAQDLATHKALPGRIEHDETVRNYLNAHNYIVVSPQMTIYRRNYPESSYPNMFPKPANVDHLIDYLVNSKYAGKIDERRIYLVGYSSGANTIMEYVGSSVARASRIAAVMPISLCSQLNHFSNVEMGVSASNIAAVRLPVWFVYCKSDNCGIGLPMNVSKTWVDAINAAGGANPRLTTLSITGPKGLYACSDTLAHDAWSRAFDPNFTASYTGDGTPTNPADPVNMNIYDWFTTQTNAVLPVTLQSFTARLINKNVELKWTTTDEKFNASFTIERAGADQKFSAIGTIPGAKDHSGDSDYFFTDSDPLAGLGLYRLVQTDVDGKRTYLQIRKVLNRNESGQDVVVYPNPFSAEISAFISLQKSQKISVSLTDMSGKVIRTLNGLYPPGSSEVRMPSGSLTSGIYFLKLQGADFNFTRKIVKQ